MIINFEGRDWHFDTDDITIDEWRELKRKYKMTPKAFQDGIGEADPDASTFLYWVLLRHNGQPSAILGDHLKPDIVQLNQAAVAAMEKEEAEQEAAKQAELEAAAAAAVPTRLAGPLSPAPPSRPDTTPTLPEPLPAEVNGSGSGTAISSAYAPSTSSPSPVIAGSTPNGSAG